MYKFYGDSKRYFCCLHLIELGQNLVQWVENKRMVCNCEAKTKALVNHCWSAQNTGKSVGCIDPTDTNTN